MIRFSIKNKVVTIKILKLPLFTHVCANVTVRHLGPDVLV